MGLLRRCRSSQRLLSFDVHYNSRDVQPEAMPAIVNTLSSGLSSFFLEESSDYMLFPDLTPTYLWGSTPCRDSQRLGVCEAQETTATYCIILLGLRPTPSPRKLGHGVLPPHWINIGSSPWGGLSSLPYRVRGKGEGVGRLESLPHKKNPSLWPSRSRGEGAVACID
jgi:hypothetical protein